MKRSIKLTNKLLDIENLSVSFNTLDGEVDVVKNVSFSLFEQHTMALVGESGSGKSVTAMSILRLHDEKQVKYSSGKINFHQDNSVNNILDKSEKQLRQMRGRDIAMIFQEPMTSLNPTYTIGNQLIEPLMLHEGLSQKQAKIRAVELLALTELDNPEERYKSYPHLLSGGQRQRVMIAMALACNPKLLIADEPTTALDVTVQLQILLLLEKLKKEFSMSILLITHNLNLVKRFADEVCVMKEGEIVEQNTTEGLFANPHHEYTQKLLNSEPERMLTDDDVKRVKNEKVLMQGQEINCRFPLKKNFFGNPISFIHAVEQLSLVIRKGETLGIVGESGSGKSTLGRCLLQLQKCEGSISFEQKEIQNLSFNEIRRLRKDFQMVFQDPFSSLSPRMTVEQLIGEGLSIHFPELNKEQRREKIIKVLNEVGLEDNMIWRYPHEFSGGQRQRIAIARVVVLEPKLIVLDEPTSALDVSVQKQVLALLHDLQQKYHMAYLFITHDLKVIEAISHYLLVMKDGKIVESGETEKLFTEPTQEYTKNLLSASLFKEAEFKEEKFKEEKFKEVAA
ncbi:MAG: ABC transporter ATP-binding protein [Gammaproteobacteria bacterium]|nr:ABC transporter ATP-binding protein [Gammaproteobacteria bacterium]